MTQGEDQTESRDSIEHACLESGWLARLALVNDNEKKLYNYLNAHGLGVYYTITTSHGMNHHYSTAGLSPSAIPSTAARCPRGRTAAPALQGSRPEVRE